jgi:hypothetical protein
MRFDPTPARRYAFSPCRSWRYLLGDDLPPRSGALFDDGMGDMQAALANRFTVAFLMLNPSTADETQNDPTIRRVIGFSYAWGYRRWLVGNIFAWRDTSPAAMKLVDDPVGPDNDEHLRAICREADLVVCAWGNHGTHRNRAADVVDLIRSTGKRPHVLRLNEAGARQPEHPLYMPADTKPQPWST